jgi:hypothetical protein
MMGILDFRFERRQPRMKAKLLTDKTPGPAGREVEPQELLTDVRELILGARQTVARGVNAALVLLHWQIGQRIRRDILGEKRAEYGEGIVAALSRQLAVEFGGGFAEKNLRRMVQFAEVFPDEEIVATLSRQLGWSHFVELLPLKKHLQRNFYAEMCRIERWSVRTLRRKIAERLCCEHGRGSSATNLRDTKRFQGAFEILQTVSGESAQDEIPCTVFRGSAQAAWTAVERRRACRIRGCPEQRATIEWGRWRNENSALAIHCDNG